MVLVIHSSIHWNHRRCQAFQGSHRKPGYQNSSATWMWGKWNAGLTLKVKHCPNNDGGNVNSCAALEGNPNVASSALSVLVVPKAHRANVMYLRILTIVVWMSKSQLSIRTLSTSVVVLIRCMGDDCLAINKSQSTDFARATALLNAAQFLTQDMGGTDKCKSEEGGWKYWSRMYGFWRRIRWM